MGQKEYPFRDDQGRNLLPVKQNINQRNNQNNNFNRNNFDQSRQNNTQQQYQQSFQPNFNRTTRSSEIYDPIVNASRFNSRHGLIDLENIIKNVNSGQKDLEVIHKMDNSLIYKAGVQLIDRIKKEVGVKVKPRDIFTIFRDQQRNVQSLNKILASMSVHYRNNSDVLNSSINSLLDSNMRSEQIKQELEQENDASTFMYGQAKQNYSNIDRNSDPMAFNQAVRNYAAASRSYWQNQLDNSILNTNHENFNDRIDTLLMQNEILNIMLQSTIKLSYSTKLYQDCLNENFIAWSSIKDLAAAVSHVSQGVDVLANYNEDINRIYSDSINQIINTTQQDKSGQLMSEMNSDVRNILDDVQISQYRQY